MTKADRGIHFPDPPTTRSRPRSWTASLHARTASRGSAAKGSTTRFSSFTGPASPASRTGAGTIGARFPSAASRSVGCSCPISPSATSRSPRSTWRARCEVMHESTGENIDLLGHSQGGLEPRWVIKWFPAGAFVDDYIALATPNHGASMFDKDTADGREIEAGWQMRTDSNFLAALNRGDETPGPIDYTSIYSNTDELIRPVGTQGVEGGANILLQDLCPGRRVDHGGDRRRRRHLQARDRRPHLPGRGESGQGQAEVRPGCLPRRGKASVRTAPERDRPPLRRARTAAGALRPWLTH